MPSMTLKGPESIPQETQPSNMPRLPSEKVTAVQQEALASEDHSRSPTFHRWFERHTGLSLDEALALGLAKREHAST